MSRVDEMLKAPVLGPGDGERLDWTGGFGVRFMLEGAMSGGGVAIVEHPLGPRALAAPMHVHANEDEYTYVLEGEVGFQLGDETVVGRPGDLVFKPRGVWHAFWNAGDAPARMLEVISPAGFERFFAELPEAIPLDGREPDEARMTALLEKYGLEMDFDSIPVLAERHGLVVDPADAGLVERA